VNSIVGAYFQGNIKKNYSTEVLRQPTVL